MGTRTKEVDFHEYCPKCEHKNESEFDVESKCYDCLDEPMKADSHKPAYFKENKK